MRPEKICRAWYLNAGGLSLHSMGPGWLRAGKGSSIQTGRLHQIATGLVGKLEKRVICGVVNKIAAGTR